MINLSEEQRKNNKELGVKTKSLFFRDLYFANNIEDYINHKDKQFRTRINMPAMADILIPKVEIKLTKGKCIFEDESAKYELKINNFRESTSKGYLLLVHSNLIREPILYKFSLRGKLDEIHNYIKNPLPTKEYFIEKINELTNKK